MKKISLLVLLVNSCIGLTTLAQPTQNELRPISFGSIKPKGWLRIQMEKDLKGFVGHLDQLVPDLINDPIYGTGRLKKNSKAKDLGNLKSGDAEGDEQYKWWNSETQSNWWDGYLRHVLLLNDTSGLKKVHQYVQNVLTTQDSDGYLGIYDKDLRYRFQAENGELWAKTTLYRGLLAYYEGTKDPQVLLALTKAVDNVMTNYPIGQSHPFAAGNGFTGGVSHGLTFTDVLYRLYYLTGNAKYMEYAVFLYHDFSNNPTSEKDAQLNNILDTNYRLQSHGVHTYEHIRPLIVAAFGSNQPNLHQALATYLARIKKVTTATGGASGDEWIQQQIADATHTGYEFCSLHELMDSYALLMQKTGNVAYADEVETIFFNAAQGARHPQHSSIAYLKTDNSYEMVGTKNGEIEPNRKQTRYKYSPVHQDVAVCCVPNAGRITPYFLQNAWLKQNETTLVAALLIPNVVQTTLGGQSVTIENQTNYPHQNEFSFQLKLEKPQQLTLKIRKPAWVKRITTNEVYRTEGDLIVIDRVFGKQDRVNIAFHTQVRVLTDSHNEHYFAYGALMYAHVIQALEEKGRKYAEGFEDTMYKPVVNEQFEFVEQHQATYYKGTITVNLKHKSSRKIEKLTLIPVGKTILRQVSF
ncbi:MAG: glycoside hydrolase family 127 protein [Spirosomataceae bacterium]